MSAKIDLNESKREERNSVLPKWSRNQDNFLLEKEEDG